MNSEGIIRAEQQKDLIQVNRVIKAAFQDHPYGNQKEHLLVADLRSSHALSVSLVAERDKNILGHIAFSKVTINSKNYAWHGLAPVAVDPKFQNQGIGSQLIIEGLKELKNIGAKGCVLLGDLDYYERFGFQQYPELIFEGVSQAFFLALPFYKKAPSGKVKYHKVFEKYS